MILAFMFIMFLLMQKTSIKVSDLLLNPGSRDTISIVDLMLDSIPNLRSEWISTILHLQSIDNSSIIATLEGLSCDIDDVSDVSGEWYVRHVWVDEYKGLFVLSESHLQDQWADPIFPISEKNETIDIGDLLYQGILLQEPLIKRTPEEELQAQKENAIEDYSIDNEEDVGGLVVIRSAKK